MVICEVMASYKEGGLENHFIALCNGLVKIGHEVHVIVDKRFAGRFDPHVLVHTVNFSHVRYHPLLLLKLRMIISNIKPDVVHAHAGKASRMIGLLRFFLGVPSVTTIHNLKRNKSLFKGFDGIIGVSKGVLEGIRHDNAKVIYNGIQSQICKQDSEFERFVNDMEGPLVCAIGRLVSVKGFDVLIKALRHTKAQLILVGDGPQLEMLKDLTLALGIESRVHFMGFIGNAGELLKYVDLLVISSYKEGFNYVMAEALVASVPIVSTDVPAPNEILPKQYLVPCGDFELLGEKINYALNEKDKVKDEYSYLFSWAKKTLTVDNMVSETADFLQKVIDNKC